MEEGMLKGLGVELAKASGFNAPFKPSTVFRLILRDYWQLWQETARADKGEIGERVKVERGRMDKDGEMESG